MKLGGMMGFLMYSFISHHHLTKPLSMLFKVILSFSSSYNPTPGARGHEEDRGLSQRVSEEDFEASKVHTEFNLRIGKSRNAAG